MAHQMLPLLLLSNLLPLAESHLLPSPSSPLSLPSPTSISSPGLNVSRNVNDFNTTLVEPLNQTLLDRSTGWSPAVALQNSQGVCPAYAYINCQSITEANYCCSEGTYCAYGGEANHIGCCADADTCSGAPPSAATTVWVPSATGTTWWAQSGTTVTELIGPVYTVTTTATEYATGSPTICSTMYARGSNLPTTAAAECGLVLVLNDGWRLGPGFGLAVAMLNGLAFVAGALGLL